MYEKLNDPGEKIAVLNFADKTRVGGGFVKGSIAQEEMLCHESTLSQDLYNNRSALYEIQHGEVVVTENAKLIRDPSESTFLNPRRFIKPINIDLIITQAAYNLNDEGIFFKNNDRDLLIHTSIKDLTKEKVKEQLRAAYTHGCTTFITGAFGTGVFDNPKPDVAEAYAEVLEDREFSGRFKKVVFAIPGRHTDYTMKAFKAPFEF